MAIARVFQLFWMLELTSMRVTTWAIRHCYEHFEMDTRAWSNCYSVMELSVTINQIQYFKWMNHRTRRK
ncbi:hypothetical protein PR003_g23654 [Phytophthora rubi]|uniref:Secreted protein n=1 Tax=Phytophthora rubi TaxID=129364 RepID=A0A6A4CUX7_9STRA|nr:hypothetical protein PR002_g19505 [Phytophthora rubi]KAE9296848.1 hypothetical protein PR003_g23654 [Phytophthora rubi]